MMISKVHKFFTFTLYIRTFIEIYMLTTLILVSEVKILHPKWRR